MRKTWIVLAVVGVVPALGFYVLEWTGATEALRYVSTTTWRPGSPSLWDLACLAAGLVTWVWLKLLVFVFLLAACPFAVADLSTVLKRGRTTRKGPCR
ncbi:MAG TPA: hypothetical protein VMZ92_02250 [Planctomycetota bacterium]|nr:hypothetical protein [Planctomycetota bacterium]